jgi:hypothetical protein
VRCARPTSSSPTPASPTIRVSPPGSTQDSLRCRHRRARRLAPGADRHQTSGYHLVVGFVLENHVVEMLRGYGAASSALPRRRRPEPGVGYAGGRRRRGRRRIVMLGPSGTSGCSTRSTPALQATCTALGRRD